jgi:hypothetical protein
VSGERLQTHLVRPSDQVARELQDRIAQGRELLTELDLSARPVPERLEQFGAKYWDWHDDNATLLKRVFSTSEIEQSYSEISIEKSVGQLGFADLLRDLALYLQRDISFLVQLHDRLRGYDASPRL